MDFVVLPQNQAEQVKVDSLFLMNLLVSHGDFINLTPELDTIPSAGRLKGEEKVIFFGIEIKDLLKKIKV